ncbi:MAG: DUF5697 family protein [Eubacteriales bacterium]
MRTRAEIYGNEAATLLRTVTMYPGLSQQQLLCFHPGKSETAKALLSHLERQGRIFQSDNGGYFPAGYPPKADQALIKAVWVLLDFIQQADYHAPAEFPVKLVFFADGELYEVAYVARTGSVGLAMLYGATRAVAAASSWSILRHRLPKSAVK